MASTIKLNYDLEDLNSVVNYDCKCDAKIWIFIYNCKMFIIQATEANVIKLFTAVIYDCS
jgi:hypothetical protein